jgi:enterochelin esterase family protein
MTRSIIERAQAEGTPLIDGEVASFVWRGKHPPTLAGDFNNWDTSEALRWREAAPGVWQYKLKLPRDAYIEYAYFRGEKRLSDPFSARTVSNGAGAMNYFFYMPDGAPTPLAERQAGVPRGKVTRHRLDTRQMIAGARRSVYLYEPYTPDPYPLVVVYDGPDYLRRARLAHIVDNLIAGKRIRPIALAMLDNGGPARMLEYGCADMTLAFLLEAVLPLARKHLNLIDVGRQPGAYGVLGASMGGLMAAYTGLRMPQVFGRVLSQSGAFRIGDYEFVVADLVRKSPVAPIRVWMDVGKYEWLLPASQAMVALLKEKGYTVAYREYNAGHNYPAWRDEVWRGLEWLFGYSM